MRRAVILLLIAMLALLLQTNVELAADRASTIEGKIGRNLIVKDEIAVVPLQDGRIVAYDLRRRSRLWSIKLQSSAWLTRFKNGVYAVDAKRVYSIDPKVGEILWSHPVISSGGGPALIEGSPSGIFVSSEDDALMSIDPSTGEVNWKTNLSASGNPLYTQGKVFIGTKKGGLAAISPENGRVLWLSKQVADRIVSKPVVFKEWVIFADASKKVYAVRVAGGALEWESEIDDVASLPLIADDNLVVVMTDNGAVYGLDARNGKHRWKYDAGGFMLGLPVISKGSLIFGSNDGLLYKIDLVSGQERGRVGFEADYVTSPVFLDDRGYVGLTRRAQNRVETTIAEIEADDFVSGYADGQEVTGGKWTKVLLAPLYKLAKSIAADTLASGETDTDEVQLIAWPGKSLLAPAIVAFRAGSGREINKATKTLVNKLAPKMSFAAVAIGPQNVLALSVFIMAILAFLTMMFPILAVTDVNTVGITQRARDLMMEAGTKARKQGYLAVANFALLWGLRLGSHVLSLALPYGIWSFYIGTLSFSGIALLFSALLRTLAFCSLETGSDFKAFRRSLKRIRWFIFRIAFLYAVLILLGLAAYALLAASYTLPMFVTMPFGILLALGVTAMSFADIIVILRGSLIIPSMIESAKLFSRDPGAFIIYHALVSVIVIALTLLPSVGPLLSVFAIISIATISACMIFITSLQHVIYKRLVTVRAVD